MAKKADQKLDMITEQLKALDQLGPMCAKIDAIHSSLGALRRRWALSPSPSTPMATASLPSRRTCLPRRRWPTFSSNYSDP